MSDVVTTAAPAAAFRSDQYIPLAAQAAIDASLDAARSDAERVAAIELLLQHGLLQDARAALAEIGDARAFTGLSAFCERLWRGEALLRQTLADAGETPRKCSSVLVAPCAGATRCIVVFSGIALLPFPTLPAFSQVQDCHLVFLFDPTRRFLLARTPRLGGRYEQTRDAVADIVRALGGPDVYCAGVSSGGYPALRFGLELGANGVLAFSGPTTIDMNDDPGAPMSDYPQLVGIYRSVPHLAKGMAQPYDDADPRPGVVLIYGDAHKRDRFMAELLGKRVGPERGVALQPIAGFAEHDTFSEMMRRGTFAAAIDTLLTLTPFSDQNAASTSMSCSAPLPPAAR
jgi:hypothetical protein